MAGNRERIQLLEAENTNLRQWVEYLKGTDAIQLTQLVSDLRTQANSLAEQINSANNTLENTNTALKNARARIIETDDIALLQEVGIYQYRHPLDNAVAYKDELKKIRIAMRTRIRNGTAVHAAQQWQVEGSLKKGAKMTKDMSKLMLRAYNSEADNIVRTLRPYALESAIARLDKARTTIARLGTIIQLRINEQYHRLRIQELELTADFLQKVKEEKELEREERARQREEEKARKEMEIKRQLLQKERAHYENALGKLGPGGDREAIAEIEKKLSELDSAIEGIKYREANPRTGYVYVISNIGSFGNHIVKIGLTRRLEPMDRVRELGDASVPFKFDVHALIFSKDAVTLENQLHTYFADKRVNLVNLRREFFYITPAEVQVALMKIAGQEIQQVLEFHEVSEAEEWRESGGLQRATDLTNEIDSENVSEIPDTK